MQKVQLGPVFFYVTSSAVYMILPALLMSATFVPYSQSANRTTFEILLFGY